MASLLIYFFSYLSIYSLIHLVKFLIKIWWTPIRIESLMKAQGIRGPSYRFLHGNTKEIIYLKSESMKRPMELSHNIFPKVMPHSSSWMNLYGTNYLFWYGPQAQLVITEPELIKEILRNKDGAYNKVELPRLLKRLFGDGFGVTRGEKWSKMRTLASPAFHGEGLKSMTPEIIESVEGMLERWRHYEGKEIDVLQEFNVLTSEVISRTAFGNSFLQGQHTFDMIRKLSVIISRNMNKIRIPVIERIIKTRDDIQADKLEQGIRDIMMRIINEREKAATVGGLDDYGSDFLGLLLKAYHATDETKKISLDEVIDECKTFYFAGYDTTSVTLSWTVLLLSTHTDWQEKARNEVLQLLGGQNPSPESIAKLKIMSMIVNESLRLYPPSIGISRRVERQVRLGKLILPVGMEVHAQMLAVHHDPQIWGEDAHLFKPERFAEGVANATNNKTPTFFPFGLGPRTCLGNNYVLQEIKMTLSMILQRYRFTLSPAYAHCPIQEFILKPRYGVQIILQPL